MVLSHSRDPFCRYVTSMDLGTFWDCHTEAFAHFGGVPAEILYDRTKTVVRRHVGRNQQVPLHPEAIAFAAHHGFSIRVCEPARPQTKGRVERMVEITREKVCRGRSFCDVGEMNRSWAAWLPTRRAQVHRTHGQVIAVAAARDRAALSPLPEQPYVVCERHLRVVGKDALVSFERSLYSVPWRRVHPGCRVELRVRPDRIEIYSIGADPVLLAAHRRAKTKGSFITDEAHWEGLPDGRGGRRGEAASAVASMPLATPVARRSPAFYDRIFATGGVR